MTTFARDASAVGTPRAGLADARGGLLLALLSAASFGAAGALATPALQAGWSPGALVLVRVGIAALVLLPVAAVALRAGRRRGGPAAGPAVLAANAPRILVYGLVAVAGTQFCYFSAVSLMPVGPALLIEFTAPAAIVVWLWLRHGERPSRMTLLGAALAALGLVLVLDLVSGGGLDPVGVLWALGSMLGVATYFVMSANQDTGLPPVTLAASGLLVGSLTLVGLGLTGLLPLEGATTDLTYAGTMLPWWLPLATLALVTAALAYVTGIGASRRLGSRLASFVALLEVVAGIGFAWLLLAQLPGPLQLVGGLLVLGGVVIVKLAEPARAAAQAPVPALAVHAEPGPA